MAEERATPAHGIVVVADIVGSSRLDFAARQELQQRIFRALDILNRDYDLELTVPFTLTLGDEFQGLASSAMFIPGLVWDIEELMGEAPVRIGIGRGEIHTPFDMDIRRMDGPAFHTARRAIEEAHRDEHLGGYFLGFGSSEDIVLNGLSKVLHRLRSAMTPRQRQIVSELRKGKSGREVARLLGLTPQRISLAASAAGWNAYRSGEEAWREALRIATTGGTALRA